MNVFETLADPTRRQIVDLLAERDRTAGELCDHFEVSQPAVSRHLRVLREAGLVASRSEAQRRIYRLTPEPLVEVDRWLERHRDYWRGRLDKLGSVLSATKKGKGKR